MRSLLSGLLSIFVAGLFTVGRADTRILLGSGWQLSVRAGIEHSFTDHMSLRGGLGIGVPGILLADLFGVVGLNADTARWHVAAGAGVPNTMHSIGAGAVMVSPGLSFFLRWRIRPDLHLDIRLGGGYPLFFEKNKPIIRDSPLLIWPDFVVCLAWKL